MSLPMMIIVGIALFSIFGVSLFISDKVIDSIDKRVKESETEKKEE